LYSGDPRSFGGYGNTKDAWSASFAGLSDRIIRAKDASVNITEEAAKGDLDAQEALQAFYLLQPMIGIPFSRDVHEVVRGFNKKKSKSKSSTKTSNRGRINRGR